MKDSSELLELCDRVDRFIRQATESNPPLRQAQGGSPEPSLLEDDFNRLALELYRFQSRANGIYRAWCAARQTPDDISHWSEIPALPITAFKEQEVTCLRPEQRELVFLSSGTTQQERSRHFHGAASLALYEASLRPWFRKHLLPELNTAPSDSSWGEAGVKHVVVLTPRPTEAKHSSLAHMMGCVARAYPADAIHFCGYVGVDGAWELAWEKVEEALTPATAAGAPVLIMGTAFLFVHLLDELTERGAAWKLPDGSRLMETGGYKGRSRELSKASLHAALQSELGLARAGIVSEYGMSELSSQAYDATAFAPHSLPRVFCFPPWARVQVVSPETGREVADGQTGVLQVFDLANVASALAIQTEDLGVRRGNGFEWLGRIALAELRGCSLASEGAGAVISGQ